MLQNYLVVEMCSSSAAKLAMDSCSNDILSSIISFLSPVETVQVALTSKRFGGRADNAISLAEESARRRIEVINPDLLRSNNNRGGKLRYTRG